MLALLEDIANGRIRRERVFRDYYAFLAYDDDWLISRFRFLYPLNSVLSWAGLQRESRISSIQLLTTLV